MTEPNSPALAGIEQKLRGEVRAFMQKAHRSEEPKAILQQTVFALLRAPERELTFGAALERLEKMLAAQRRWSRIRHHAYDLNRHILLERTCRALQQSDRSTKLGTCQQFK